MAAPSCAESPFSVGRAPEYSTTGFRAFGRPRGGVFLEANSVCGVDSCTPGACCNGIVCSREIRFTCEGGGRTFNGPRTTCDDPNVCPCSNDAQCDDGNGCTSNDRCVNGVCVNDWHKGATEWSKMATCLSNAGPSHSVPSECHCYDLDRDGDVDLHDVARFLVEFSLP